MLLSDFIFALFAALVLSVVIAVFLGWRHPARPHGSLIAALGFAFLTIFLAALVGGMWIRPVGPRLWGTAWVPSLAAGLVVSSILLAVSAPVRRRSVASAEPTRTEVAAVVFGGFFWFMIAALVVAFALGLATA